MSIIDLASWPGSLGRLGVILRHYEMKDKSSRDACRERDGRAPSPIGNDAQGNYHEDSQCNDFESVQNHAPNMLLKPADF